MYSALMAGLHVNGPDGDHLCREYAQESPQAASKREELEKKLPRKGIVGIERRTTRRCEVGWRPDRTWAWRADADADADAAAVAAVIVLKLKA